MRNSHSKVGTFQYLKYGIHTGLNTAIEKIDNKQSRKITIMGQTSSLRRRIEPINEGDVAVVEKRLTKSTSQKVHAFEEMLEKQSDKHVTNEGLYLLQIAKKQLARNELAITKDDLIAIILSLDIRQIACLDELRSKTVSDLNYLIRSIIYDPEFHFRRIVEQRINNQTVMPFVDV